jgi:hypothetical protein
MRFDARIEQDPDRVWAVLTDVNTIPDWSPAVQEAHFDGAHRHLRTAEGTLNALVITKNDEPQQSRHRRAQDSGRSAPGRRRCSSVVDRQPRSSCSGWC